MELHGDAWRILLHAVQGRELLPAHIQDYAKRAMARVANKPSHKDDVSPSKKSRIEEPGSASSVAHASTPAALPSSGRDAKGEQEEQALPLELPAKKSRTKERDEIANEVELRRIQD